MVRNNGGKKIMGGTIISEIVKNTYYGSTNNGELVE
jgi:hypothetical protein